MIIAIFNGGGLVLDLNCSFVASLVCPFGDSIVFTSAARRTGGPVRGLIITQNGL
jgi:hypothetical protein